ncbi:MAG TPA: helix-turn-helix transcriptional regulator [Proteiniclasticum sp.]|nr:helix-turn-helix transcriptional regulator [Proteiniclasticum sp.]
MTFSEKLKYLRKEKEISQEELAKVIHVTRQSVSKWETGTAYPDMEKMKILSDFYKISLDDLMNTENVIIGGYQQEVVEEDDQEDLEENLNVGGFVIGIGLGVVTGNFLLGTAGGLIGLGLPYLIRSFRKIR